MAAKSTVLNLRISEDLKTALSKTAKREKTTLSDIATRYLSLLSDTDNALLKKALATYEKKMKQFERLQANSDQLSDQIRDLNNQLKKQVRVIENGQNILAQSQAQYAEMRESFVESEALKMALRATADPVPTP